MIPLKCGLNGDVLGSHSNQQYFQMVEGFAVSHAALPGSPSWLFILAVGTLLCLCKLYLGGVSIHTDIRGYAELFSGQRIKQTPHLPPCSAFWALVFISHQTGGLFCYFSLFLNWDLADLCMMLNTQFDSLIFPNQLNFWPNCLAGWGWDHMAGLPKPALTLCHLSAPINWKTPIPVFGQPYWKVVQTLLGHISWFGMKRICLPHEFRQETEPDKDWKWGQGSLLATRCLHSHLIFSVRPWP